MAKVRWRNPAPQVTEEDYLRKMATVGIDADGFLIPDPVPLAPPIGYKRQPSMVEVVRNMVRSERLALEAELEGYETFEESEDFEVDDDFDTPGTEWENDYEPTVNELRSAVREERVKRGLDPLTGEPLSGGAGGSTPPAPSPPAAPAGPPKAD